MGVTPGAEGARIRGAMGGAGACTTDVGGVGGGGGAGGVGGGGAGGMLGAVISPRDGGVAGTPVGLCTLNQVDP